MNKQFVTISSAIASGALSKGATGSLMENSSNTTKLGVSLVLALGAGFLSSKVTGDDTKAQVMKGAAIGVCVVQGLEVLKFAFSSPSMQSRIASNRFLSKTVGLSGLSGYLDNDGNYREDGMNGYIDPNGNYIEDGMNAMEGYYDENGNYIEDGMNAMEGYYDEYGNYHEDGMNGYIDPNGNYIEDGMNAMEGYDDDGNYIEDGMNAYQD
jgi:hypothetical protein